MSSSVWLLPNIRYDRHQHQQGKATTQAQAQAQAQPSMNCVSCNSSTQAHNPTTAGTHAYNYNCKYNHNQNYNYNHRIVHRDFQQAVDVYVPIHKYSPLQQKHLQKHVHQWRHTTLTASQCLCSFWSANPLPKLPVIWYVHGGAWLMGNRYMNNVQDICTSLAEAGYYCVSIGYRTCKPHSPKIQILLCMLLALSVIGWFLADKCEWGKRIAWMQLILLFFVVCLVYWLWCQSMAANRFPTQLIDISNAIRRTTPWLHHLGADCTQSVLMGHSAGAHLAATLYASPHFWPNTGTSRTHIRAIALIAGVYSAELMRDKPNEKLLGEIVFGSETSEYEYRSMDTTTATCTCSYTCTCTRGPNVCNHSHSHPHQHQAAMTQTQTQKIASQGVVENKKDIELVSDHKHPHPKTFRINRFRKEWDRFFAEELIRDNQDISWPPVLMLSAWFDYGLRMHSERLAEQLHDIGTKVVWHTVYETNHFDITCFWRKKRHAKIRTTVLSFLKDHLL